MISSLNARGDTKKYVRFLQDGKVHYGELSKNKIIHKLKDNYLKTIKRTSRTFKLKDVKLLAPVKPSKIIAVGLNYRSHAGMSGASHPNLFSKVPSSLAGPDDPIFLFKDSISLHYEGELVIIISKKGKNIPKGKVHEYIFGVTAGNDVTDRGWQRKDLQWIRAKGADSFSPIGPWIVTGLNYNNLLVRTKVNGRIVQSEKTSNLIHSIDSIVSYTSRYFTLEPGDIIFTGTPGKTSSLKNGDIVEIYVEGVGTLRNVVTKK